MSLKYNKLYNILAAIGFMNCWLAIIVPWYSIVYPYGQFYIQPKSILNEVWVALIMAPIFEEIFFRKIWIDAIRKYASDLLLPGIIMSSLIFAWWHDYGYWGILVQGVLGLVSSWLYLKNDNSLISCIIFHAGYNYMCIYGWKSIL